MATQTAGIAGALGGAWGGATSAAPIGGYFAGPYGAAALGVIGGVAGAYYGEEAIQSFVDGILSSDDSPYDGIGSGLGVQTALGGVGTYSGRDDNGIPRAGDELNHLDRLAELGIAKSVHPNNADRSWDWNNDDGLGPSANSPGRPGQIDHVSSTPGSAVNETRPGFSEPSSTGYAGKGVFDLEGPEGVVGDSVYSGDAGVDSYGGGDNGGNVGTSSFGGTSGWSGDGGGHPDTSSFGGTSGWSGDGEIRPYREDQLAEMNRRLIFLPFVRADNLNHEHPSNRWRLEKLPWE